MTPTVKLYEMDVHLHIFEATVLTCEPGGEGVWRICLDRTAFYPEGGGQPADRGTLGGAVVMDVREAEGVIIHDVDAPLVVGDPVEGHVDWDWRFPLMQLHSGEHVVSGIVLQRHGYDNVGFHMGREMATIDFSGPLTTGELEIIEQLANDAVFANLPITTRYPAPEELAGMSYRSKKALSGDVRIVSVPGHDDCACCGTHVSHTGEIGLIKLLSARNYKGGTRVELVAGRLALRDYTARQQQVAEVSVALSAKPMEIAQAVRQLQGENDALKKALEASRDRWLEGEVERFFAGSAGEEPTFPEAGLVLCLPELSATEVRKLCLMLLHPNVETVAGLGLTQEQKRGHRQELGQELGQEQGQGQGQGQEQAQGQTQRQAQEQEQEQDRDQNQEQVDEKARFAPRWMAVLSGSTEDACLYAAGAVEGAEPSMDAGRIARHLKAACGARGGGTPAFVQGTAPVGVTSVLTALRVLT